MSTYYAPNHNRLLDLENHILQQQSGAKVSPKRSEWQPVQQLKPLQSPKRQAETLSQAFSKQQRRPTVSKKSPMSPKSKQVQPPRSKASPNSVPHHSASEKPRSMHPEGVKESYRKLAGQMGKHYSPRSSAAQKKNNDLPVISTPISQEVVEDFAATESPKRRQQTIDPPAAAFASISPSAQPSWKGLAKSIRQAKQGVSDSDSGFESNNTGLDQSTIQTEFTNSAFDKPSIQRVQNRTSIQRVLEEGISQERNQQQEDSSSEETATAPVTIDVMPTITTKEESRVTTVAAMFSQDLDLTAATQVKELTREPVVESEELLTNTRPYTDNASAPVMANSDNAQKIEHPIPTAKPISLKGKAIQLYQFSRPYVVDYLTLFQRKTHHFKETHD